MVSAAMDPKSTRTADADDITRRVSELERRVAELTEQLQIVTRERDEARRALGLARITARLSPPEHAAPPRPPAAETTAENRCPFCDGEGTYWVHDFEMECKRCGGSGRV